MKNAWSLTPITLGATVLTVIFGLGLQSSSAFAGEKNPIPPDLKIDLKRAVEIAGGTGEGRVSEIELEEEDGKWVYEVEFVPANGKEKEILIDANSGAVVPVKEDKDDDDEDDRD